MWRRLDDREFVAPETGERIAFPKLASQPLSNLDEKRIADFMAERVVDGFEAVDIQALQRERRAALRLCELRAKTILKEKSVW